MGWASGSQIADEIWDCIKKDLPKAKKRKLARLLIDTFESFDCDTMYECTDIIKAAGYKQCEECNSLFDPPGKQKLCEYCDPEQICD